MLLLSTGKRRQRKHFKKLKLHTGKQDREEEKGGGAFSARVACKAEMEKPGLIEEDGIKLKDI